MLVNSPRSRQKECCKSEIESDTLKKQRQPESPWEFLPASIHLLTLLIGTKIQEKNQVSVFLCNRIKFQLITNIVTLVLHQSLQI